MASNGYDNEFTAGKDVVITGAASPCGRAVAERLAADGYALALLDRDAASLTRLCRELRDRGARAWAVPCDTALPGEAANGFNQALERLGGIDALIHAEGMDVRADWLEQPVATWDDQVARTLDSAFLCMQRAACEMIDAGTHGAIVLVMSELSFTQGADTVFSSAVRFGERGLMRNVARSVAKRGIRVNGICPAGITGDVDWGSDVLLGRPPRPEDVAALVAYLLREGHSITGQSLPVAAGVVFA